MPLGPFLDKIGLGVDKVFARVYFLPSLGNAQRPDRQVDFAKPTDCNSLPTGKSFTIEKMKTDLKENMRPLESPAEDELLGSGYVSRITPRNSIGIHATPTMKPTPYANVSFEIQI